MDLKQYIASVQDFPKEGILFRDITPLMAHGEAFKEACLVIENFAKEKEVFKTFITSIQLAMSDAFDYNEIYIDATHLNEHSRQKVLNKLNVSHWDIYLVNFTTPIEVCIERNSHRTGRAFVPESVIKNMESWRDNIQPVFKYDYYLIEINEKGEIVNEQDFSDK